MEPYIKGNKEAWEEAFSLRAADWGRDIPEKAGKIPYAFFNEDTAAALAKYDLRGKSVGQFCCNNGRELLSLVQTTGAASGTGFDIAENQVAFANDMAGRLSSPCRFVAINILDIDDCYANAFDFVLITIGALCWFKDLDAYFKVVSRCLKPGGSILINEQHPFTNMLALEGEAPFNPNHPTECHYSYFSHTWLGNSGMAYITGRPYTSKTFTDFTHPLSEILTGLCSNGFVVTGFREFQYDISDALSEMNDTGFPLSMLIEGKKINY